MSESDSKSDDKMLERLKLYEESWQRGKLGAPMSKLERYVCGVIAISMVFVLGLAWFLEPAKSGFGTHQQLGLPPCTFQLMVGIPCPSCGMTTSFAYVMHGNLVRACQSNWAGALTACSCVVFIPWSILSISYQRFLGLKRPEHFFLSLVLSLLFLTFLHWCFLVLRWY